MKGPRAASRSMIGLIDSSCGASLRGFQVAKSVFNFGLVSCSTSLTWKSPDWFRGVNTRSGGVGDLLFSFCFWERCRDLRPRIEPAHDLTFFCFLLGLREIDDLLEPGCSVDWIGVSDISAGIACDSATVGFFDSLLEDEALVGRDFGDDSPECASTPKNDHFFIDLGVVGEGKPAAAASDSRGREPRRLGAGVSGDIDRSRSRIGSAVRGRVSDPLLLGARPLFSFEGGEVVPDMIDDIELVTECPGLTVEAESDETIESGRGMI